ncbi:MAG TPA: ABC transporter permease subunit [Phycisphaerae bacterium]|nr:ABC transporter permease subunit [Phycisphaerae bacterium]
MRTADVSIWKANGLLNRLVSVPARLVGPIFTKELRVSSRRRRNFVLRGVYVAALIGFVALVWLAAMESGYYGSMARRISRMEMAGKRIILAVVWFQFIVAQLLAVIMLSTSISEEVYHRTLGVLMTTPINSFQVVVGKLLSKMLQLLMLLATSLPVLAVVRVLGGIPWDYLLAGLALTLTTSLLFAAVTMFFSILCRRAFVSILLSLATLAVLYGGIPLIVALAVAAMDMHRRPVVMPMIWALVHYNPYGALTVCTEDLFRPGAATAGIMGWGFYWWGCCAFTLVLTGAVLAACVAMVRRVGLRMVAGETGAGASSAAEIAATSLPPPPPVLQPVGGPQVAAAAVAPPPVVRAALIPARGQIRSISGSPIVWREVRTRWMQRRWLFWTLFGIAAGILLLIYGLLAADNDLDDDDTHAVFLCVYTLIATVAVAVLSATNITSEKEANSWEILLATPLSNWHILGGKAAGILRRCLPVWLLPIGHVLLFMMVGYIHPVLLPHMMLVAFSVTALYTGAGLFFGVRFKRTTTAVILNLALGLTLWLAVPGLIALAGEAVPHGDTRTSFRNAAEFALDANPFLQAGLLAEEVGGEHRTRQALTEFDYSWPWADNLDVFQTTAYVMGFSGGYLALGGLFAGLAWLRIRKRTV